MPVALRILLVREEPLRHDEVQVILGARHRHIEKPAFFLDFRRRPGAEVGWNAAVDDVEHEDRFPFLALGRMNGGKDQVILVEQGHARLVACRVRRIECQLRQKALA